MERWITKLVAFLVIFITMTLAGLLPIKVSSWFAKKGEKGVHYLSVLSCFGGGVFFGTYLMHMAPEVRAILEESLLKPYNIIFPVPELMAGVGFFLLLFVDKIVMVVSTRGKNSSKEKFNMESSSDIDVTLYSIKHTHESNMSPPSSPRIIAKGTHNISHSGNAAKTQTQAISNIKEAEKNGNILNALSLYVNDDATLPKMIDNNSSDNHNFNLSDGANINIINGGEDDLAARPYIFLVALSIDCIFEGMTLGLQTTNWGVWMLVIAILSHELVICFSFGLRILKLFSTKKVIFLIMFYACTIPVGVAIGFAILETTGTNNQNVDIVSGIFQAMSGGIFVYVSFLEILNEELTHDSHFSKLFAVSFGFVFMASMVLIDMLESVGHNHGMYNGNRTNLSEHYELSKPFSLVHE